MTHKGKERKTETQCHSEKRDEAFHREKTSYCSAHLRIACVAVIDERGVTISPSTTPTRAPWWCTEQCKYSTRFPTIRNTSLRATQTTSVSSAELATLFGNSPTRSLIIWYCVFEAATCNEGGQADTQKGPSVLSALVSRCVRHCVMCGPDLRLDSNLGALQDFCDLFH